MCEGRVHPNIKNENKKHIWPLYKSQKTIEKKYIFVSCRVCVYGGGVEGSQVVFSRSSGLMGDSKFNVSLMQHLEDTKLFRSCDTEETE